MGVQIALVTARLAKSFLLENELLPCYEKRENPHPHVLVFANADVSEKAVCLVNYFNLEYIRRLLSM